MKPERIKIKADIEGIAGGIEQYTSAIVSLGYRLDEWAGGNEVINLVKALTNIATLNLETAIEALHNAGAALKTRE